VSITPYLEVKTPPITGIIGQDGSFLAEFLLAKGYLAHGIIRRASSFNSGRIDKIYVDSHDRDAKLFLHYGDLTDGGAIWRPIDRIQPDEIYNLAAQSHVRVSFDEPEFTADAVALGTLRILEVLRCAVDSSGKPVQVYQTGSSEMFDARKPDVTPCKLLDVSKLHASGWRAQIGTDAGTRKTSEWYLAHAELAANR
jgi:GDPmannose 4,6-dehydratase